MSVISQREGCENLCTNTLNLKPPELPENCLRSNSNNEQIKFPWLFFECPWDCVS